jgi:hypothetical protein
MENYMSYLFNDKVGFVPTATDAFGRLTVANPFTLFDSTHRYRDNGLWVTGVTGSGSTAAFNPNQGLVDLTIGVTSDNYVYRETTKVFPYQPGKSLQIMSSFTMNLAKSGLRQRTGYFGSANGFYVELDGSDIYLVKRSSVSGSTVNTRIAQSNWNGDTLNGNGQSGITLDISKTQLLWMDLEWLGAGSVRMGFVIDGVFIICHTFHQANVGVGTYMTTGTLPLRYEIENTSTTASQSTMKQICSTVISFGGYELYGSQQGINTPIGTSYTLTTKEVYYPVISLRLKSTSVDAVVIMTALSLLADTTGEKYNWQVVASAVTTGGTWISAGSNSAVEYNLTATTDTGGRILASGFFSSTTNTGNSVNILKEALFKFQLERNTFTNTQYELVLLVTASQNTSKVFASMDWEEISR